MTVQRQENSSGPGTSADDPETEAEITAFGPDAAHPAVSVVVINFNYERYLTRAVESALAQGWRDTEVIVVDDCSTDGSRAVIADFGTRVTPVLRAANGGMSASANSGFLASKGEIVMFLDADDYLHHDAVERVVSAWSDGIVQMQGRLDLVDSEEKLLDVFPPLEVAFDCGDVTPQLAARGRYSTTVTTGLAFGRAALDQVMPIPEAAFDRSADGYLATVVPLYGRVAAIETTIGGYRRHESNHSGFSANIAKRARWRLDHDEQRYRALKAHGQKRSIAIAEQPGLADATHLEQRLVSLCLDRAHHPYASDSRLALGLAATRAALAGRVSPGRKLAHAAIALVVAIAPRRVASAVLSWKLEQSSRPQFINAFAKQLRRLLR